LVGSCAAFALQAGAFGLRDAALSLPTIVGRAAPCGIQEVELRPRELQGLRHGAGALRQTLDAVMK